MYNKIIFIFILINLLIIKFNIKKKNKKNIYFIKFKKILITLIFISIIKLFIYESFQIPSASMLPTLLIGDIILVNKIKYNIKNPFNNKNIININKPKYGDIIVFKYPKNKNINYIKRIIGLPNDKIIYNKKNKKIYIYKYNNIKKKYNKKNIVKYKNILLSKLIEEIYIINNNIYENFWNINNINFIKLNKKIFSKIIFLIEKIEYIQNNNHKILLTLYKNKNIKKNKKKIWIIPKNMYFVMGDYRDNSEDSRYLGFINKNLIIGKAEYILISIKKQENFFPTGIRFNRIGKII